MPFVNFPMKLFAYDSVWNKIYPGWRFEISIWNSAGSRRSEIEIEFGFSLITELPGELLAVAGGVQMTSFVELPSDENKTTILDSYARVFQNWNKIYQGLGAMKLNRVFATQISRTTACRGWWWRFWWLGIQSAIGDVSFVRDVHLSWVNIRFAVAVAYRGSIYNLCANYKFLGGIMPTPTFYKSTMLEINALRKE